MNYNPYSFSPSDVIAWNGIIGFYGVLSPYIAEGDNMRRAHDYEVKSHNSAPDKSPYTA
jgi:hypothetical protein